MIYFCLFIMKKEKFYLTIFEGFITIISETTH